MVDLWLTSMLIATLCSDLLKKGQNLWVLWNPKHLFLCILLDEERLNIVLKASALNLIHWEKQLCNKNLSIWFYISHWSAQAHIYLISAANSDDNIVEKWRSLDCTFNPPCFLHCEQELQPSKSCTSPSFIPSLSSFKRGLTPSAISTKLWTYEKAGGRFITYVKHSLPYKSTL